MGSDASTRFCRLLRATAGVGGITRWASLTSRRGGNDSPSTGELPQRSSDTLPPVPQVKLNFDDALRHLLESEAAFAGISIDAYVREAVLMRLITNMRARRDPQLESLLERLCATADEKPRQPGEESSVTAVIEDPERLRALDETGLLDSAPEESFDRMVRLAAEALGAPMAAVSLVDDKRQFFKSSVGLPEPLASAREAPLSHSLCQYAVSTGEPVVVEDAREDPTLRSNGSVTESGLVAYVGIPLVDDNGHALGTLCVWDSQPREWTRGHVQILEDLARMTTQRILPGGA